MAGPTDVRQAKSTLACVIGWRRTSSMRTPGRTPWTAITIAPESIIGLVRPLVLASSSPRRAELLRAAGLPFVIRAASIDETRHADEPPEAYVRRLALAKARAVARGAARARPRGRHGGGRRGRLPRQAVRRERRRGDAPSTGGSIARGADRRRAGAGLRAGGGRGRGDAGDLRVDDRRRGRLVRRHARALRQGRRLRGPGPGLAVRHGDRRAPTPTSSGSPSSWSAG